MQVYDTQPPVYPAGDGIKVCIFPPNNKYVTFANFTTSNAYFGLGSAQDACSKATQLKWTVVGCTPSAANKGHDPICKYDSATDTLSVPAVAAHGDADNIFTIKVKITDPCGNGRLVSSAVAVLHGTKRMPAGCGGKYISATEKEGHEFVKKGRKTGRQLLEIA